MRKVNDKWSQTSEAKKADKQMRGVCTEAVLDRRRQRIWMKLTREEIQLSPKQGVFILISTIRAPVVEMSGCSNSQ